MAQSYFCRQFKKETGMTLTEFISRTRVRMAQERLLAAPGQRVTDIAMETGFGSITQFNVTFRYYAGMSPTQYRKARGVASSRS